MKTSEILEKWLNDAKGSEELDIVSELFAEWTNNPVYKSND
jgi:hypothetical protein